ncbi:hypothetical protein SAMN05216260_103300 [Streptomyces griseoaurantiacus]|uniref:Uncharacterized protein n=1 Tax=Streptomyces griseoaurantiacus TaxID=68213 RepID=A0A1G7FB43_9ACTN|nr:hypothetical protein SAMN05216260_103300 [Streptomyces jietaisiensis]
MRVGDRIRVPRPFPDPAEQTAAGQHLAALEQGRVRDRGRAATGAVGRDGTEGRARVAYRQGPIASCRERRARNSRPRTVCSLVCVTWAISL